MLTIEQYRKKYQVVSASALGETKIVPSSELALPVNAMIHYRSDSIADMGLRGNDSLLFGYEDNQIFSEFVLEGYGTEGKPIVKNVTQAYLSSYYKSQTRIRRNRRMERLVKKPASILVQDYSLLSIKLSYKENVRRYRYEFENLLKALVAQINAYPAEREHFIPLTMPLEVIDKTLLNKADGKDVSNTELGEYITLDSYFIREIYLLASGEGLFSKGDTKLERPQNVNVLLRDSGNTISFNLGVFLEVAEGTEAAAQKDIAKLVERLASTRTTVDTEELPELTEEEKVTNARVPKELQDIFEEQVKVGNMTYKETERMIKLGNQTLEAKNPFGDTDQTIEEYIKPTAEEAEIDAEIKMLGNKVLIKPNMRKSSISKMRPEYGRKIMKKDILRTLVNAKKLGIIIKDIQVEEVLDAANDYMAITFSYVMPNGKSGTRTVDIQNISKKGTFKANGVEYITDLQAVDDPVRKIKSAEAVISSYSAKLFMKRSQLARHNRGLWLSKNLANMALSVTDERVFNANFAANKVPNTDKLPLDYVSLMKTVSTFNTGDNRFTFRYDQMDQFFTADQIKQAKRIKAIPCGFTKKGDVLAMTFDDNIVNVETKEDIGSINGVIGGKWTPEPLDKIVVSVFGKEVPLAFLIGKYIGIDKLLELTGAKVKKIKGNFAEDTDSAEFRIRFRDTTLIVDKKDKVAAMILAGFQMAGDFIKNYNYDEFNTPEVYTGVFTSLGLHQLAIREMNLMRDSFIDPMTEDALQAIPAPTDFIELLMYTADLLKDDSYPDKTDPVFRRYRSYERVPGFLHKTLVDAARIHRGSGNPTQAQLDIRRKAVWSFMAGDPSTQLVQAINPTHTCKEQESVTLTGEGGLAAGNIMAETRAYHKNDLGTISEANVDSAKVGVKQYTCTNPAFTSLRGKTRRYKKEDGPAGVLSTAGNILPAINHDVGARAVLAGVQQSAVVPAEGYMPLPYQTGHESTTGARLDGDYTFVAQQDGEVTKVKDGYIQVTYKDGTKDGFKLGTDHGEVAGKFIRQVFITDKAKGSKVDEGEVVAWNSAFYDRDFHDPRNVVQKHSCMMRVALIEGNDNIEDGSAIDDEVGELLATKISKQKSIPAKFTDEILGMVSVGDELKLEDILLTVVEQSIGTDIGDDELSNLARFQRTSPKAGITGKVSNISVMYQGDPDDIKGDNLRELVKRLDKERAQMVKDTGVRMSKDNSVKGDVFFAGELVSEGTVVIRFMIDGHDKLQPGSKMVIGNQLKSVPGRKIIGVSETESGDKVNVHWGFKSCNARTVFAVYYSGAVSTVQVMAMERFVEEYER